MTIVIVSREGTGSSLCGGSLVAPNMVLTAAHCRGDKYTVILGAHELSNTDEPTREYFDVVEQIIHPQHRTEGVEYYDAMLLILDAESTYDSVTLDGFGGERLDLVNTETLVTIGFGTTGISNSTDDDTSETLQETEVRFSDAQACKNLYGSASDNTILIDTTIHLCAGSVVTASCTGDSGGPLLKKMENGSFVEVGLVSWGPTGCLYPPFPVVYTNVGEIYPWVSLTSCSWAPSSSICIDSMNFIWPSATPTVSMSPTLTPTSVSTTGNPTMTQTIAPNPQNDENDSDSVPSDDKEDSGSVPVASRATIASVCFISWMLQLAFF